MEDLNRTLKCITISTIESIINDDNVFSDFVRGSGSFYGEDKIDYLNAINQYMDYQVKHTTDLPKNVFVKVNYLNDYFGSELKEKRSYDFDKYLSKTHPLVNVALIESILSNDNIYNKFMAFENNRNLFPLELATYLNAITDFVNYYSANGMNAVMDSEFKEKFNNIMKQYSLEYKTASVINGYVPEGTLDPSIIERVLGDKYRDREGMSTFDKFAMCRDIYIELCKIVDYDVTFSAYDQNMNIPIARDIYNKSPDSITLENNAVVCKTWAEMYAILLGMVGITAKVDGNFHKFVVFDCDGTLMKADATNNMMNIDAGLFMCDLAAIQIGLPTAGFCCDEEYKDVHKQILMADMRNRYEANSQEDIFDKLKNDYYQVNDDELKDEIEYKLELLNIMCKDSKLRGLQLVRYYNVMFEKLFNSLERANLNFQYVAYKDSEYIFDAGVLISRRRVKNLDDIVDNLDGDNYEYDYFVFFKDGGTQQLSKEALENLINQNNFVIFGKKKDIPGLKLSNSEEVSHGIAC